jgi:hypothetical protein
MCNDTTDHSHRGAYATVLLGLSGEDNCDHGRDSSGTYEVTVYRAEVITYRLLAVSAQDAEERYLLDGEEESSETDELRVDATQLLRSAT